MLTVPPTARGTPGVETRGFHVWPVVCALGRCCVIDARGSCAEEVEGAPLQEVCETS